MKEPVIKVERISKKYRIGKLQSGSIRERISQITSNQKRKKEYIWALKNISFEVAQGEIMGIIGANGSGKSTLLKILSRITMPTWGKAKIIGNISSLLEVGTGFHPELTGKENIFLNASIHGMGKKEIQSKLDEIIDFSGIGQFMDTPVKHYSSGMFVRLGFSVAAHLDPDILLVDEVLSVGDTAFREKSLGKINDLVERGRTILFVSHNMGMIRSLCTQGILLDKGEIVISGTPEVITSAHIQQARHSTKKIRAYFDEQLLNEPVIKINGKRAGEQIQLFAGDPFNLEIKVESKMDSDQLRSKIVFLDEYLKPVLICNNRLTEDPIHLKKGINQISCHIEKFPLNAANYTLEVRIMDTMRNILINWDHIDLKVISGAFYKSGLLPNPASKTLADHVWKTNH